MASTKPTILAVDDDPVVSQAIVRDLRKRYGGDYDRVRHLGERSPRPRWRSYAEGPLGRPGGLGPEDAADDRHRDARRRTDSPLSQAVVAHGVRRHRCRDQGDQRHRPRLLHVQAVGPAGGAALPRRGRPARRLGRGQSAGDLEYVWSGIDGPTARTRSRCSWRATTCRTGGSTWTATKRAPPARLAGGPRRPSARTGA